MMTLPSAIAPLAQFPRWVGWRWVTLPDGKRDKPPFRGDFPEFHASTTKPNSWVPFQTAAASVAAGKLDGIGYVCADDAERVYWDLDKCIDPITGAVADWATEFVEECDTYTEITPSGRGLRIIGTHGGALKAPIHAAYTLPGGGSGEVFFRAVRYITVTGNRLPGTPDRLADISGPVLDLLARAGKAHAARQPEFIGTKSREEATAPIGDVRAALAVIPNADLPYDDWVRIGIATFAATAGTGEGYETWQAWSAKSGKHQDAECLRVWRSVEKSPPKRIGFGSLCYLARAVNPLFVAPSWLGETVATTAEPGLDPTRPLGHDAPGPAAQPASDVFPTLSLAEVMALPPPTWLVKGVLTEGGFATLYAPPASYKTFVSLGLALCIAYGDPWMGREVKQTGVLYIAGEGVRGLGKRIKAWQRKHKRDGADAPFRLLAHSVNLTDPAQTAKVIKTAMAVAEAEGCPIGAVFIDTVARSMAGADENSAQDMGRFVEACGAICREIGATVIGIHHTGKDVDRGARGSNALLGGVDTEIKVERHDDRLTVTITKQKDDDEGSPIQLRVENVDLGGPLNPQQSLVVVTDDEAKALDTGETMAQREARMRALGEVAKALGPDGRLTTTRLVEALGWPAGGRAKERIAALIPFAPGCAEVTTDTGTARLWRIRQGEKDTSPIIVRRQDVQR
jgi:hypothetical protein